MKADTVKNVNEKHLVSEKRDVNEKRDAHKRYDINEKRIVRRYPVWKRDTLSVQHADWLAEEVPVALVYNGISHVVMMACPQDLDYFAIGFSLSEGIIASASEIYHIELIPYAQGIEVHIELSSRRFMALKTRRRTLAGRTGCGLCGIEQLSALDKPIPPLPVNQQFALSCLDQALSQLDAQQPLCQLTGCTHVATWVTPQGQLAASHEDIGRHVALDKLLGRRACEDWQQGAVLISSRASYEMVQKTAMCGVEILFAVSAATTLAVDLAQRCRLTLVGFCRSGRATVYSHPQRLIA